MKQTLFSIFSRYCLICLKFHTTIWKDWMFTHLFSSWDKYKKVIVSYQNCLMKVRYCHKKVYKVSVWSVQLSWQFSRPRYECDQKQTVKESTILKCGLFYSYLLNVLAWINITTYFYYWTLLPYYNSSIKHCFNSDALKRYFQPLNIPYGYTVIAKTPAIFSEKTDNSNKSDQMLSVKLDWKIVSSFR